MGRSTLLWRRRWIDCPATRRISQACISACGNAGIRIVTLAEGEISELHIGLKGTMNALFLRGRVEAGHSGGGNAFGYRVVRRLGADGQPVTGERQIDEGQAAIVTRIFKAYAAGESPKKIALRLNGDAVPGPRVGAWSSSTLNGNRARGTGILNNDLYVGQLCWNRLSYVKDPETGRRRSRQRTEAERIQTDVPALRIIDQTLWDAVKQRQRALDCRKTLGDGTADGPTPFWSKQRPRYLFSGLMRCGSCGGGFSKISATHFGCSTARNKGPTACTNRLSIRRDVLENGVLEGLRERLMDPALFKEFATAFTAEWNRLQGNTAAEQSARTAALQRVRHQIERLVDAITEGTPASAVRDRLQVLEQHRLALEAEAETATAPAPRLHPNLAEAYRHKVADLVNALSQEDSAEARELVRGLVDHVTLHPEVDHHRIEGRGEPAAILGLAGSPNSESPRVSAEALSSQVKLVAGIRNHRELVPLIVVC